MFKSPIDYLKDLLATITNDLANAAFSWLKIYLFQPTDFAKYPYVHELYNIVFTISISLGVVFFIYNLMKIVIGNLGGYNQRSVQEVIVKTILAGFFSAAAPFLITELFLPLNNAVCEIFFAKGLNTDTLSKFVKISSDATITVFICAFIMMILFVLLAIQSLFRIASLLFLLAISPLAAWSMINEDMSLWQIWVREVISTCSTQALHVALLWLGLNQAGDAKSVPEFLVAWVFLGFTLFAPSLLRKYLYSSGTGRATASLAGGASKMAIYRMAARRVIAK